jgi:thiamine-phosphate pyrophosphorylase
MKNIISGGVYLVLDPSMDTEILLDKLQASLRGGASIVQLWNNWKDSKDKHAVIDAVCTLCKSYKVPVIINEEWQLLQDTALDGVHFDKIPGDYSMIKKTIDRSFIAGITCNNHLDNLNWAIENGLDYISFCSMFPSSSANSCGLVDIATVQEARRRTTIPIFLAGGISMQNMHQLKETGFDGVALISGILNAADAEAATAGYKNVLHNLKQQQ